MDKSLILPDIFPLAYKTVYLRVISIILCAFFHISLCNAQYSNIEFVENKGQWNDKVKYKGEIINGSFFLEETGFRVLLHDPKQMKELAEIFHGPHNSQSTVDQPHKTAISPADPENYILHSHAYEVQFINAGKPAIAADKPLPGYNNYIIGNDPGKWKGNCKIFQAVTYSGMYPNIDVRYYTDNASLKYDMIVKPGADPSQINIKYDGVDKLSIKDGQLIIQTSLGEIKEMSPYAYQLINGIKKEVKCSFKIAKNVVSFIIEDYSKSDILVIDPTLIFATFTGSMADNWGYTATYGPDGSFYSGGIVFKSGFPVSTGALQGTFNGGVTDEEGIGSGYDIGIMKFNSTGSDRVYATYLGGNSNEQPHSMVVDAQGNLIISGRSKSNNYPSTGGTIGTGGNYDIILTKLNASGSGLIGSRKIGGAAYDGVNIRPKYASPTGPESSIRRNYGDDARSEVILDGVGNILLASNTQSGDFPLTSGAIQTNLKGRQDAVFIKMDATLTNLLYSTYLGGSSDDAAFVLAINPSNNNVYIGGNTNSADLPGDKTNVIYPSQQGNTDGFISIFSPAGVLLKTSYIGTQGFDMLYGIQFDKFSFPYIMGTTTASWPVTPNVGFSQSGGKQFISKLQPDLSGYVYSTVFGTAGSLLPNISPIAFLVDRCENVYVSGWGGSANINFPNAGTHGLSVTADAIKKNTDDNDFYFFVLEKNAQSQLYGSFFGQDGSYGEHVDGGTSRFDRSGVIYQAICANCTHGATFPTTPGVWSRTNNSDDCNLAAVKIAFNFSGVAGSVRASINNVLSDTVGCVPLTVNFTDTLGQGKKYLWRFGDGSADVITIGPTISHTFNAIGNYRVMLVSIDSQKCNLSDTAFITIRVKTDKATLGFNKKKLEPCTAFNYRFINETFVTPPGRAFAANSFVWNFGDNSAPVPAGLDTIYHSFPAPGVYVVKLTITDTNFCNAPETIIDTLRIAANVLAKFETPLKGCAPYNAFFNNTSDAGEQFFWTFGDGATSTAQNPTHLYATPGVYTVKLVAIDSGTCNKSDSISFTITVSDKPHAAFTFAPVPPQINTPVQFYNAAIGAVRYEWIFGDGENIKTTSTESVEHIYNETNTFQAMLVAINISGCADTAVQIIEAKVSPLLDVPTAFTPNSDGINDIVMVRGYGIAKMNWKIYNRWGSIVFETTNRKQAWDGKYKGVLQPAEVYHYTLAIEYSDNTHLQKLGDITLLR